MGGRVRSMELRDWLVSEVAKYPEGVSLRDLAARYRRTTFDVTYDGIYNILRELTATHPKRTYPQRLRIVGYTEQRRYGVGAGGRPSPIYMVGTGPNELPTLTKEAEYRRRYRARERALDAKDQEKVETERRRALKRKPVVHELTAALFGMKPRRK